MEEDREQAVEGPATQAGPFAAESDLDPALEYVVERWARIGDDLVIEGKVTALTATWELKRGDYNSETVRGHVRMEPDNLKADIVVRKPLAEIVEADGDLGVVGQVFNRLGQELSLSIHDVMVKHMEMLHTIPTGEDKPRASGGVTVLKGGARQAKTEVL